MRSTRLLTFILLAAVAFGQRSGGSGHGAGHSAAPVARHSALTRQAGIGVVPVTNRRSLRGGPVFGSNFGRRGFQNGFRYRQGYGLYAPYFPLSGYDFYAPYSPLYGDDQFAGEYPQEYPANGNTVIIQPAAAGNVEPAPPASSVIHEYKLDTKPAGVPGERLTFTIVLKNGTTRSAAVSWVQNGKLHYLDSQSRQQLLSPEAIDRDATERANEQKNLRMDLPPG